MVFLPCQTKARESIGKEWKYRGSCCGISPAENALPNRIVFNRGPGVLVESGTSVFVVGNSISAIRAWELIWER